MNINTEWNDDLELFVTQELPVRVNEVTGYGQTSEQSMNDYRLHKYLQNIDNMLIALCNSNGMYV